MDTITTNLFDLAESFFVSIVQDLDHNNIWVSKQTELRSTIGLFPYYNWEDGHIYLALPDFEGSTGQLHRLFLRSLLSCPNDDELFELFRLFIPWIVAHELGHCLRHQHGLFDKNDYWHEEEIANRFSLIVTKNWLSVTAKGRGQILIQRALAGLDARIDPQPIVAEPVNLIYYHLCSLHDDLVSSKTFFLNEFAQQYLGCSQHVLPTRIIHA